MTGQAPEIRMGNDIARQFGHLPEREAGEHIATHIEKFWETRMIRRLLDLVDPADPEVERGLVAAISCMVVDDIDHEELVEPSGG